MTRARFWGPMFPDAASRSRLVDATLAELSLAPTQTNSGVLDNARIRARQSGTYGNGITVEFTADALTDGGELLEDVGAKTVHIKFAGDSSNVGALAALLAASELVELVGSYYPSDVLATGDDEFAPTNLTGGVDARYTRTRYWGPHYPDRPATGTISLVPGGTPAGVAAFVLMLESGARIAMSWITDFTKKFDGSEQRMATLDAPQQHFSGSAYLVGASVIASVRANLERYAASGAAFQLGLPHEELPVTGPMASSRVPVSTTLLSDWANAGQRCAIVSPDASVTQVAVIQIVEDGALTLDVQVDGCDEGWSIVPTVAVYLDPQQGFTRYPCDDGVEAWQISARAAGSWFDAGAVPATLALAGAFNNALLAARVPGVAGNSITVQFEEGNFALHGEILSETSTALHVGYNNPATSGADIYDLIDQHSALVRVAARGDDDEHPDASDQFGPTLMTGGAEATPVDMGRGAELAMFDSSPVFDRGVDVDGSVGDAVHGLTSVQDLGGEPFASATATKPDWGRAAAYRREEPEDRQWLWKFLGAARGRARTWWLPTFRPDLTAIGDQPQLPAASFFPPNREMDLTVATDGLSPWYPDRSTSLELEQDDGTIARARITSSTDNGDGTTTLRILADPGDGAARLPDPAPIERISWLDLCRFEADQVELELKGATTSLAQMARVVQG